MNAHKLKQNLTITKLMDVYTDLWDDHHETYDGVMVFRIHKKMRDIAVLEDGSIQYYAHQMGGPKKGCRPAMMWASGAVNEHLSPELLWIPCDTFGGVRTCTSACLPTRL